MKKLIMMVIVLLVSKARATEPVPYIWTGSVVTRHDEKKFSSKCSAERDYIQINANPDERVQKINRSIRREMTVGRELKASDCPSPESREILRYKNLAQLSGQRNEKIGTYNVVYFPGGSGRYVVWCDTYEVRTANKVDLAKCAYDDEATLSHLSELLCNEKVSAVEGGQKCGQVSRENLRFCLHDEGVEVTQLSNGSRFIESKTVIRGEDLKNVFKPSCAVY